ncbi:hypothetical protein A3C96_04120 [Candidatus Uhrbacteria bacterium RIFCSPHIGHO2_02_FULL_60_10]|uniref:Uncharacterized protein n=1 Tax=Candidatus Uhrbacteria bacterium RIFCSPHIGHO2_02_FULL_60_10 TaxID=1802392 RepID=A0A1F7U475_9BACT|nr:MAG: hypothetical protein A3C96_04120 [Candidatus Uhrbacteria bacterium RIFCSPHIGHO2_02_FULL_60_10]
MFRAAWPAALFGLFLLASLASFVARHCSDIGTVQADFKAAPACREHTLLPFLPDDWTLHQFILLETKQVFLPLLVFAAALIVGAFVALNKKLPSAILNRRRYLFWIWARVRPFVSGNSFIPGYVAQRDA